MFSGLYILTRVHVDWKTILAEQKHMHCNDVILTHLNFVGVLEFAVSNPGGIYVHHCNSTKFCHNFLQENVRETHTLGLISLPLGLALINSGDI